MEMCVYCGVRPWGFGYCGEECEVCAHAHAIENGHEPLVPMTEVGEFKCGQVVRVDPDRAIVIQWDDGTKTTMPWRRDMVDLKELIPNPSARFFYEHMGQSHPAGCSSVEIGMAHVANAYELAGAERDAQHLGLFGEWELDDCWASFHRDDIETGSEEDYPLWICGLANQEADGEWVESLSGIDLGPNGDPYAIVESGDYVPYARVVEAELALQHFESINERLKRAADGTVVYVEPASVWPPPESLTEEEQA